MVRTATHWPSERPHPDPIRIVAISASIALNIAALALLMRPPEMVAPAADSPPTTVRFVDARPIKKLIDPVPVTRKHVEQNHAVAQQAVRQTSVITRTSNAMSTDPQPVVVDPQPIIDTQPPQPVEASLMPIASPAPTYPPIALRDGVTGTVELELLVGVDGRVVEVHVTHSSGNRQLDNAAREQVLRNWRFQPALRDGMPVQALGRVPIVFTLDGR